MTGSLVPVQGSRKTMKIQIEWEKINGSVVISNFGPEIPLLLYSIFW